MTQVQQQQWGRLPCGRQVEVWRLRSSQLQVEVLTLGCIIRSLQSSDSSGRVEDVVLGFDSLEGYLADRRYFGAVVGRVANRIAGGQFVVGGQKYQLDRNHGANVLHGGPEGFNKAVWSAAAVQDGVLLRWTSPDGDQGFPGELQASVCYTLKGNCLTAEYEAQSSRTSPVSLSNHSYFNLGGQEAENVYDHQVSLSAASYLPVDHALLPTGEVRAVDGTRFDLRKPVLLGPLLAGGQSPGFDHNFCLCGPGEAPAERPAARVVHPASGRVLEVSTTQPGLQLYTANALDGSARGKAGRRHGRHSALCLETQGWPDAVNQASFPCCLLQPGEKYHHVTRYTFSTL